MGGPSHRLPGNLRTTTFRVRIAPVHGSIPMDRDVLPSVSGKFYQPTAGAGAQVTRACSRVEFTGSGRKPNAGGGFQPTLRHRPSMTIESRSLADTLDREMREVQALARRAPGRAQIQQGSISRSCARNGTWCRAGWLRRIPESCRRAYPTVGAPCVIRSWFAPRSTVSRSFLRSISSHGGTIDRTHRRRLAAASAAMCLSVRSCYHLLWR